MAIPGEKAIEMMRSAHAQAAQLDIAVIAVVVVPDEFCDEMALVRPVGRIRERYRAWAECGITGLTIVSEQPEALELMANLAGEAC